MRFKFAEHAPEVSAAWIWARMVRLSRSRTSPWREELGYVEGGSQVVLEALARDLERRGGRVVLQRGRGSHRLRRWAGDRRARGRRDGARRRGHLDGDHEPFPEAGARPRRRLRRAAAPHPHHRDLLPVPAPLRAGDALLLGEHERPAGAVRGDDRVHQPEPAARAGGRSHPVRAPVPVRRRSPLRAERRRGAAHVHRRPGPHQPRVRSADGSSSPPCSATGSPSPSASPTTRPPRPPSRPRWPTCS